MEQNPLEHRQDPDRAAARFDLRLRRTGALTTLLEKREDLRGVNATADLLDDAVRWCA